MAGKKGQFGRLVIGEEEAAREQEEVAKGIDYFGPAVVGEPQPQRPTPQQLKDQPDLARLHGLSTEPAAAGSGGVTTAPPVDDKPAKSQLSLEKLKEALDLNPFILDTMIDAEFERAEGPRKEALRTFIKEENKKGEPNRRAEVLERLASALTAKPATATA